MKTGITRLLILSALSAWVFSATGAPCFAEAWNPAGAKPKSKGYGTAELWLSTGLSYNQFEQANFGAKFRQTSATAISRVSYNPVKGGFFEGWIRGFASFYPLIKSFSPAQDSDESVRLYNVSAELHFRVVNVPQVQISPIFGGWVLKMLVQSKNFGIERAINPVIGAVVDFQLTHRSTLSVGWRFVPLQQQDLFRILPSQAYNEYEAVLSLPFYQRARWFFMGAIGTFNYNPPNASYQNFSSSHAYSTVGFVLPLL